MARPTFDLDVLRTFVTGVELASFAQAADRLGRSTSAVSAQLKKLEEQVGSPVLSKAGRGLALTPVGEVMLSHARRLLDLNDSIFASLHETQTAGTLRLGLQEDFGEQFLSGILRRFARLYPLVTLEVRIGRNAELLMLIDREGLDVALTWQTGLGSPGAIVLGHTPMQWIGPGDKTLLPRPGDSPSPLVMFGAPCVLRSAATAALDRAGIAWRIALTSPSVSGLWAAVDAGLGVTLRTRVGLPAHLAIQQGLPDVPSLGYELHRSPQATGAPVDHLVALIRDNLQHLDASRPSRRLSCSQTTVAPTASPSPDVARPLRIRNPATVRR
ncbi:MAG: HTH-type transcriptional regulator GltC [Pseudomonas fluorescens]|nr:MAG: HTH-type transcriptional regulator GltC [Pseudomonas fluorescens]